MSNIVSDINKFISNYLSYKLSLGMAKYLPRSFDQSILDPIAVSKANDILT